MKNVKKLESNRRYLFAFIVFGVLTALAVQFRNAQSQAKQVTHVIQAEVVDEIEWPKN